MDSHPYAAGVGDTAVSVQEAPAQLSGHQKLLQQIRADGFRYVFGNPGSSEEGFLDHLQHFDDVDYILTLQESVAIAMADGYCRSLQRPALVQIHSGVGLGNASGNLYQAFRGHSPLVVFSGEAGVAYSALNGQMSADLVSMARPLTKYACRVEHPGSLLRMFRRAVKMSMTPPTGPVYVALPQDILDAPNDEPVVATRIPDARSAPSSDALAEVAEILAAARSPIILMGDGISRSSAQAELAELAELIGASVWGVNDSEVNIPQTHPLYRGVTGHMFGADSARIVENADVVLVAGTYLFPEVFPSLRSPFSPDARVIHVEPDAFEIEKNHPADFAFVADPKETLWKLVSLVKRVVTPEMRQAAEFRAASIAEEVREMRQRNREQDMARRETKPLKLAAFTEALSQRVPEETIIFDEALTHSAEVTRWLPSRKPGTFFQTRGGSLGVGFPGAMGIKLAHPERLVIGFSGDGGCMYTIQGLWTAAHYGIGAKLIVCNNHSYRLLKLNLRQYWDSMEQTEGQYPPSFDLSDPEIDFVAMAESMGVPGRHVAEYRDIAPAIDDMLRDDGPFLVDVAIDGAV